MTKESDTMPGWVPWVLKFAAIYNLAWGLYVVLLPRAGFAMAGMDPPNYPAIVQCLGMVIGVYGIGYWIAASDAATHWPIVLVGLLGKLFGPMGFVYSVLTGELPWFFGITVLTNDVAWWLPFIAILMHAARIQEARRTTASGVTLEQALQSAITQDGRSLYALSFESGLLLVCIRHFGCTFCREALTDLVRQKEQIKAAGLVPVIVHMGTDEQALSKLKGYDLESDLRISDPDRQLFSALELPFGTLSQFLNWKTTWRTIGEGVLFKFGCGPIIGSALQLSGAFVVRDGRVERAMRSQTVADRTDFAALTCEIG